ncbi:MAG: OsmC family protein [Armatimonadetes bacterium]|nr:OsmC family protein [Armatimonadota bacterium]
MRMDLEWKGDLAFEITDAEGDKCMMNSDRDAPSHLKGPSPMQALAASIGACAAMDVIAILKKKRQEVTSYRVVVEAERVPEGTYPRPFTSVAVRHIVKGRNLDEAAVKRAVELSEQKYCSVAATLRTSPPMTHVYEIAEAS